MIVKPCVGCGMCCRSAQCVVSTSIHGIVENGYCPELFWNGEQWRCKLMIGDSLQAQTYRQELACGMGCVSTLFNSDRENIPTPEMIEARRKKKRS